MDKIRKPVGIFDKYHKGRVKHIDFTYADYIVVWVEFKTKCKAYIALC